MIYDNFDATVDYAPAFALNNREHFFKYMSATTAKIVLNNGTLRWSRSTMLNDPFDMNFELPMNPDVARIKQEAERICWQQFVDGSEPPESMLKHAFRRVRKLPQVHQEKTFKELLSKAIDAWVRTMQQMLPQLHNDAKPLIKDFKILSLTVRPNIPTMWSHYADSYRGVVLRFRNGDENSPFFMAKPIDYVEELPNLYSDQELIDHVTAKKLWDPRMAVDKIIYTKSVHWSYEQEWRISLGSGREKATEFEDRFFALHELDGVIFGLGTSERDKELITLLAAKHSPIKMMQLKRKPDRFGLYIEDI
ncbi:DUF2971 domain-containing protein [Agrobacterium vitis]|uniref:DUF2971 domain-containing protein n=1 Tax=Agrobacterium vitis TaxID=373 RepID=UPI0015D98F18|nr:DUF2971 domain-containing protein [Agrobacterium vitis]MCF1451376.1 DUF2971 domain-containing protein [Agrobacterium vitis]BCH53619.1 hypothetical protein RvVAR031_12290 [Agrobacterium vitis]